MSHPRSSTLQEPQIERREHQDYSDVHHQPLPEPVPEEQDVHADHDGYQRDHVKPNGYLSSHPSFLVRAAEWSQAARGLLTKSFEECPLWAKSGHPIQLSRSTTRIDAFGSRGLCAFSAVILR